MRSSQSPPTMKTTSSRCKWRSAISMSRRRSLVSTIHPTWKSSKCSASTKPSRRLRFCSEHWNRQSRPDSRVYCAERKSDKKRTAQHGAALIESWLGRLTDPVDLGAAEGAGPYRCRFAVLHCDRLRVFHLDLPFVLQTISFQTVHHP